MMTRPAIAAACLALLPVTASAQSGSFTVMLGSDTVQVESFERSAGRITGTVAFRSPAARFVRYTLTLDPAGRPLHYEQSIFAPDGSAIERSSGNTTMRFERDSIARSTWRGQAVLDDRVAAPNGAIPLLGASPAVPFANSYVTYELAFAQARARPDTAAGWYTYGPSHTAPARTRIWLIGSDSAESDYFGVARIGYRFDAQGRLLRSDWTATTYKYRVTRGSPIDVEAIARRWGAQDAAGAGLGRYSPRDSANFNLAGATIAIGYGRPSQRGRTILGGVVPRDQVWRLGADYATHFITDSDLVIGEAAVPAGRYSLWVLPQQQGSLLVVNRQTGQFGTQYSAQQDLVRIPLTQVTPAAAVEKLTISVRAEALWIEWGDVAWTVPVRRR